MKSLAERVALGSRSKALSEGVPEHFDLVVARSSDNHFYLLCYGFVAI